MVRRRCERSILLRCTLTRVGALTVRQMRASMVTAAWPLAARNPAQVRAAGAQRAAYLEPQLGCEYR